MKNTNYIISDIYIYPVKSLGGINLKEAEVTDRGLKYDRRWMLVDENNNFLSQRSLPAMALLRTFITGHGLLVYNKFDTENKLIVPFQQEQSGNTETAFIWNDSVEVQLYSDEINEWFSDNLSVKCGLVYMPSNTERKVDSRYAEQGEITSLSDGYPFLIIGQESLNFLNSKLHNPLPMNRFRPNFVFTGGSPHDEDNWKEFRIGDISFYGVKPCSRCIVTTTNQDTGERSEEPLKTLSAYRKQNNKIMFGMNLLHKGTGKVRVGEKIAFSSQ